MLILELFCTSSQAMSAEKKILIISNAYEQPYLEVIAGFKSLQKQVSFIEIAADSAEIATAITKNKPDLIFALGAMATQSATQQSKTIPIVATLLLKSTLFEITNVTGVTLSYPFTTQIEWLKKFFPEQTKIATLFNPIENTNVIKELHQAITQAKLELIAIPVESPKQLPFALEQLAKDVQVLLAIPDEVAMSSKTAKEVLLASFINRVPLVGLSDNWVKSGALYALSWDYNDLGQQCAMQAEKLLNGEPIKKVPLETPRKIIYTINTKIAEHMNIVLPSELLQNAKLIFN